MDRESLKNIGNSVGILGVVFYRLLDEYKKFGLIQKFEYSVSFYMIQSGYLFCNWSVFYPVGNSTQRAVIVFNLFTWFVVSVYLLLITSQFEFTRRFQKGAFILLGLAAGIEIIAVIMNGAVNNYLSGNGAYDVWMAFGCLASISWAAAFGLQLIT